VAPARPIRRLRCRAIGAACAVGRRSPEQSIWDPQVRTDRGSSMRSNDRTTDCIAQPADGMDRLRAGRAQLDANDRDLLVVLSERLDCLVRIGLFKKRGAIPMMLPQRVGVVHERAAAFAVESALRSTFLHALHDLILAERCQLEQAIIDASMPSTAKERQ